MFVLCAFITSSCCLSKRTHETKWTVLIAFYESATSASYMHLSTQFHLQSILHANKQTSNNNKKLYHCIYRKLERIALLRYIYSSRRSFLRICFRFGYNFFCWFCSLTHTHACTLSDTSSRLFTVVRYSKLY